jgi:hypothetical protein
MTIADAIRRFKEIVDRFPQAADWPLVMPDLEDVDSIDAVPEGNVIVVSDVVEDED